MEYNNTIASFIREYGNPSKEVDEDSMTYLSSRERSIFFATFLLLYLAASIGNLAAITVTYKRKHRHLQKTLIISLALTDLILANAYAIQYLKTFSRQYIDWDLGNFMCSLLPSLQAFGMVASATAILCIAIDRYRNVTYITMKRWNPSLLVCLSGIFLLWLITAGLSYPAWILKDIINVTIVITDTDGSKEYFNTNVCDFVSEEKAMIYLLCIGIWIFLPLLILMLWLYSCILKLVCQRHSKESQTTQNNSNANSISQTRTKNKLSAIMFRRRKILITRKIRIFRVMIFLILAFFLLRIPSWIFAVMQLVHEYSEEYHWKLLFIFQGISLFSCCINPLLYSFLHQTVKRTMKIWKTCRDFTCEVCCCCCSNTEFEQFERENPFCVENYEKSPTLKVSDQVNKYGSKTVNKLKFDDVNQHVNKY